MRHTTLRQAALGAIAILAVVLMVEISGSAGDRSGSTREKQGCESTLDDREQVAALI